MAGGASGEEMRHTGSGGRQNADGKTQKALSAGGNHVDGGSDSVASLVTPLCGVGGVVLHLCEA